VLKEETHVEVDEVWYKRKFVVYFAIGRKTKLILNYLIGQRDYRDVIMFLKGIPEEIRYSDKITFVSDSYVNYRSLLPDYSSSESWQLRESSLGLPKNFEIAGSNFFRRLDRRKLLSDNCIN